MCCQSMSVSSNPAQAKNLFAVSTSKNNCFRRVAFGKYLRPTKYVFVLGSGGMPQGTIKKLTDKGFGFIEGERGDIFFHHSALEETTYENLREGQKVEYSEGQGPKGPRAESVRLVD